MNRITTVLSCVLALGCFVLEESRAAGFDCQTPSTAIEKAICAVPSLSDADERLTRLYERAVASDPGDDTTKEQAAWKKARDTCRDEACIASMYADRIAMLTAMVDPRKAPRTSPVLLLPALDETLPTDIVAPIDTASRRVSASAVGAVESDRDEAGNRFALVDHQGGRIPLSDLWDLSDREQDALAALEDSGATVQVVGFLDIHAEDGSAAFSRSRPLAIYRIKDEKAPVKSTRSTATGQGSRGGSPRDQYRQMGSVAALAEACYGSQAIPSKLGAMIKTATKQDPSTVPAINLLIEEYNVAYHHAVATMTVWNGSAQSYSGKPFSCANNRDVEMIRAFEATILKNLK